MRIQIFRLAILKMLNHYTTPNGKMSQQKKKMLTHSRFKRKTKPCNIEKNSWRKVSVENSQGIHVGLLVAVI
jgi:hypothetical protein